MAAETSNQEPKRFRNAKYFTALWILIWLIVVVLQWEDAQKMELNAWGDFFAGIVGPIAFLWLVLGYLQQGEELRVNTEALLTQQKEMALQVEETRNLTAQAKITAEVSQEQVEISRARLEEDREQLRLSHLPRFVFGGATHSGIVTTLKIVNKGATVLDVIQLFSVGTSFASGTSVPIWEDLLSVPFQIPTSELNYPWDFLLQYRTASNEIVATRVTWHGSGDIFFKEETPADQKLIV